MKLRPKLAQQTKCPYCHDHIGTGEVTYFCDGCGAQHHNECWVENKSTCASCLSFRKKLRTLRQELEVENINLAASSPGILRDLATTTRRMALSVAQALLFMLECAMVALEPLRIVGLLLLSLLEVGFSLFGVGFQIVASLFEVGFMCLPLIVIIAIIAVILVII